MDECTFETFADIHVAQAVATIAHGAKLRVNLRSLHVPYEDTDCECFDKALAGLADEAPRLETIVLCHNIGSFNRQPAGKLTRLLESMKSNYVLKSLTIEPYDDDGEEFDEDGSSLAWDPATRCLLGSITRLNRAGRAYMDVSPMDAHMGVRLLGKVSDDTHCILYYVRENPSLIDD